jgi:arsenate reductase
MAEGLLRDMAGDRFEAHSAGMTPAAEVHPLAVEAMQEIGIDIGTQQPKDLEIYLGKQAVHYLVVVCDRANASCPRVWPGLDEDKRLYWPLNDPADADGTEEDKMAVFRSVRDEIKAKLEQWIQELA